MVIGFESFREHFKGFEDCYVMIEIFSRRPEYQLEHPEIHLTPLHVSEEVSSLSAIMLDDDYYQLVLDGRRTLDGISVLDTAYLILFKAKAWMDLAKRKQSGMHVNDRDLRKHKNDVFRLFSIVDPATRITLPERVCDEMRGFINAMMDLDVDMKKLGMSGVSKKDIINELRVIFGLHEV